jgi:glycosyltransferase involved in cell wall biosynthesis
VSTNAIDCSVVIPTYNRKKLLRDTLESLTQQTLPRQRFEVLVVDDGSSDGTEQAVAEFAARLNVRYFFQEDQGFRVATARNLGIAHARGRVCVFIDSGVQAHPGCLAAHLHSHDSAGFPVAVIGYVYGFNLDEADTDRIEMDIDPRDPGGTIDMLEKRHQWRDIREKFYAKYTDDFADLPAPWVIFWTCNVSAGTRQLRSIGGFDEAFRSWGGEDLDLGYRLHRAGARLVLNRKASAIHLPHEKKYEVNEDSAGHNYRYIATKYGTPITQLLTLFPAIGPFTMNDTIRERGLPRCADFLALPAGDRPLTSSDVRTLTIGDQAD